MRAAPLVSLLVTLLCACTSPRTQVMVIVDAQPGVRARAQVVEITVWGGTRYDQLEQVAMHERDRYPVVVPIVPRDGDTNRVFRVQAVARETSGGTPIAVARAENGFLEGKTLELRLTIEDSCIEVPCIGSGETCTGGACELAYVDPDTLPELEEPSGVECGNLRMEPGEECDDGNVLSGDGCSGNCRLEGGPNCGNGEMDSGEECDDGEANGTYGACNDSCSGVLSCGDGVHTPEEEECDPQQPDGPLCDESCHLVQVVCGDGDWNIEFEECDDGNTASCDGCSMNCESERCGNGRVECAEECDGEADCSSECTLASACGDGSRDPGEVCYDVAASVAVASPGEPFLRALAADFDADGISDLVLGRAGSPAELWIYRGLGAGTFDAPFFEATPPRPMIAEDVDRDGRPDLVGEGLRCGSVCLGALRVDLAGRTITPIAGRSVSGPIRDIASGDGNGDGFDDFAIGYGGGFGASASYIVNDPTFRSDDTSFPNRPEHVAILPAALPEGYPPFFIAFSPGSISMRVISGEIIDPSGGFDLSGPSGPWSEVLVHQDVVPGGPTEAVFIASGAGGTDLMIVDGMPRVVASIGWPTVTGELRAAELLHVDGDADLDVVLAMGDGRFVYALGDGTGNFPDPIDVAAPCPIEHAAIGEFNGDGAPDLVFVPQSSCTVVGVTVVLSNP